MAVTFHNDGSDYSPGAKRKLAGWIKSAAEAEGFCAGDIAYVFCSPERHREINRQYLSHDYFTDVITFDYTDYERKIVSGDIFIDPATVADNARLYGTDMQEEMRRVLVHGVLHLCGYADGTDIEREQMRSRENHHLSRY